MLSNIEFLLIIYREKATIVLSHTCTQQMKWPILDQFAAHFDQNSGYRLNSVNQKYFIHFSVAKYLI